MVQIGSSVPPPIPPVVGAVGDGPGARRVSDQESERPVPAVNGIEPDRREEARAAEAAAAERRSEREAADEARKERHDVGREVDISV